jgi:FixJ family two-component response regulator
VTIHIIEDDAGVRDALAELAHGLGHPVRSYRDGESFIGVEPPLPDDVVLVDLGLPGMSGEKVIGWLRKLGRPPRIVVISGQAKGDIDLALRGLPGLRLLRKPLAPEAITALF